VVIVASGLRAGVHALGVAGADLALHRLQLAADRGTAGGAVAVASLAAGALGDAIAAAAGAVVVVDGSAARGATAIAICARRDHVGIDAGGSAGARAAFEVALLATDVRAARGAGAIAGLARFHDAVAAAGPAVAVVEAVAPGRTATIPAGA